MVTPKNIVRIIFICIIVILIPVLSAYGAPGDEEELFRLTEVRPPKEPSNYRRYLPIVQSDLRIQPALPAPIPMLDSPPLDFDAIRQELVLQGLNLANNKIGFHVGHGGNITGIGDWMADLDSAGVPFFLKSADVAGPLYEGQLLAQSSGVPHTLVFRLTTAGQNDGYDYDVPNYNLPPSVAAAIHWQRHIDKFPPELDPNLVWIETINEVDKNRSEWLAEFATATAQLALADGYKWAAFGWSSGEPEVSHWQSPAMLDFLMLASRHPNQLAIALHEYSYSKDDIGNGYPYLLGRFQALFQACDDNGILRPTILITEWGWESTGVPDPGAAMADIEWAAWLYSAYPQIRGAAIWYLGAAYGGIANQAQRLIAPVREYSLSHYFAYYPGYGEIDSEIFAPAPNENTTILLPLTGSGSDLGRSRSTRRLR
jgi:hypothetical protein